MLILMLLLDIFQVVNIVSDWVFEDQYVILFDEVLYNVVNVVQINIFGGIQDVFICCGFGVNCDGLIMINGLCIVLLCSFNVVIEWVEVLKGFVLMLYGIFDFGGLINVIIKWLE